MKKTKLLVVMLGLVVVAQAQCYESNLKEGNSLFGKGDYTQARRRYQNAIECSDAVRFENGKEAKEGLRKCDEKMRVSLPPNKPNPISEHPSELLDIVYKKISVGNVSFRMVLVDGGTFTMGCVGGDDEKCVASELPAHDVTLSSYYIGETEVTQALWIAVMGEESVVSKEWTEKDGLGNDVAAYFVSYKDALNFIRRLSQMTGMTFRLPTEAEWEFAARGGNKCNGYKYSGSNEAGTVATLWNNANLKCNVVKKRKCNELGLYDMSGNLWEWCSDWYGAYNSSPQNNPQGPERGDEGRVCRGGSHVSSTYCCRVVYRGCWGELERGNENGFRLVLEIK